MLSQKKANPQSTTNPSTISDSEVGAGNEGSQTSNNSANTATMQAASAGNDLAQSSAQWKKDETMLLQYIILNVAD